MEEEEQIADEGYEYTDDDETFEEESFEEPPPEPMKFEDLYVPAAAVPCQLTVPMKSEEYAVLGPLERTKLGYP